MLTLVGRQARIQLVVILLFGMFYLVRPGTVTASCKKHKDDKRVCTFVNFSPSPAPDISSAVVPYASGRRVDLSSGTL